MRNSLRRGGALCGLALGLAAGNAAAQEVNLKWVSSEAQAKIGSHPPNPQPLRLSETKPESFKKMPEGITAPLYGELKIGPREEPTTVLVLLDEPEGKPARLFVDSDGNGNLADDEVIPWKEEQAGAPGREMTTYTGPAAVSVGYPGGPRKLQLSFARTAPGGNAPAAFRNLLFYSRDYALAGDVKLGNKSYPAMLVDEAATGDFRPAAGKTAGIRFLIDADGDGKFDPRREAYDPRAPFNIAGTTYEIADMKADGRFRITKSSQVVEEIKPAPNLAKGSKALPFTAKTLDGRDVKFPEDYKGKVVLLDFWATWYGPSVREVPNVVAHYQKYREKGFEILGISFDHPNAGDKVASFTKEKGMSWPQVYEGRFWATSVGKLYNIQSIPTTLLIDGDTGEILATGAETRGANLGPSIESALARKTAPEKAGK